MRTYIVVFVVMCFAAMGCAESLGQSAELSGYRAAHNWHWLPITPDEGASPVELQCDLCDEVVRSPGQDSILVYGMRNDTIFARCVKEGHLNNRYYHFHRFHVPQSLASSSKYRLHLRAYGDSLATSTAYDFDNIAAFNAQELKEYDQALQAQAPNGFFVEWGWGSENSALTFNFSYMNTNELSIKSVDVYWKMTNEAGTKQHTGHFKGYGPVAQGQTQSWHWDRSSYRAMGDEAQMTLTKVIIIYANGQRKVLIGNQILNEQYCR